MELLVSVEACPGDNRNSIVSMCPLDVLTGRISVLTRMLPQDICSCARNTQKMRERKKRKENKTKQKISQNYLNF